jgi:hypothetical protein
MKEHSLGFRGNWVRNQGSSGAGGSIFDVDGGRFYDRTAFGTLSHKWVVSSNKLNELYFQLGETLFDARVNFATLPSIFVDEFSNGIPYLGGTPILPQGRTDRVYQIIDNYTINLPSSWMGSHVLKFGGDAKLFRSDSYSTSTSGAASSFAAWTISWPAVRVASPRPRATRASSVPTASSPSTPRTTGRSAGG